MLQFPTPYNVTKGYLYAVTSLSNGFVVEIDLLMNGLAKFGVLAPFPFYTRVVNNAYNPAIKSPKRSLNQGLDSKRGSTLNPLSQRKETWNSLKDAPLSQGQPSTTNPMDSERRKDSISKDSKLASQQNTKADIDDASVDKKTVVAKQPDNTLRLDNTSALFAQHYSLIRELKIYTAEFKTLIESESDIKEVWKGFENLATVLDTGCQFLSFPVQI